MGYPMAGHLVTRGGLPVTVYNRTPSKAAKWVEAFGNVAKRANDVVEALSALPADDHPVLIAGSLYLAGEVLRLNDELPD